MLSKAISTRYFNQLNNNELEGFFAILKHYHKNRIIHQ